MSNSRTPDVTTPPIMGAAMRFITSAPDWVVGDHMIGSSPNRIAQIVITFGRMRCTAPHHWLNLKNCCVPETGLVTVFSPLTTTGAGRLVVHAGETTFVVDSRV